MTLDQKIEAILFFKGEAVSVPVLANMVGVSEDEIQQGVETLEEKLVERGLTVLHKDDELMLGTVPEAGVLIEMLIKEELSKDLGKAGLETLSIVLYRGPIARSKIDYIRGVSSTFILRNLLVRGLVERISNPADQRSFLYRPTFELLSYLGISRIEDLPEYESVKQEVAAFESQKGDSGKEEKEMNEDNLVEEDTASEHATNQHTDGRE